MKTVPTNMPIFKEYEPTDELFEIVKDRKGMQFEIRRVETGSCVATLPYGLRPQERALAQLFAYAPDMLKALESVLIDCDMSDEKREYLQNVIMRVRG